MTDRLKKTSPQEGLDGIFVGHFLLELLGKTCHLHSIKATGHDMFEPIQVYITIKGHPVSGYIAASMKTYAVYDRQC